MVVPGTKNNFVFDLLEPVFRELELLVWSEDLGAYFRDTSELDSPLNKVPKQANIKSISRQNFIGDRPKLFVGDAAAADVLVGEWKQ